MPEHAHAIFRRVVAELGAGDASAAGKPRQGLELLLTRLETWMGRPGAPARFGIAMKSDDDVGGNRGGGQHGLQVLQPALVEVRDAASDEVALESQRSDDSVDLPDRFGKVLRPRRIAVVRDIRLVADLERVLLETRGMRRLDDAPGARREHVGFDSVRPVGDLHLAAGEHEERAGRAIGKFRDQRLDWRGVAVREKILTDDADAELREERELAGNRIAEPRVDAKNRHGFLD